LGVKADNTRFEDQAEQRVLWDIEAMLETTLVEPFDATTGSALQGGLPLGPLGVDVGSVLRRRGCAGGGALQEGCLSPNHGIELDWVFARPRAAPEPTVNAM
jgi:hypothetical protein